MTILDEEIVSAVESSVGSNDLRIEKDTLFIFGGASLVLFGAGMILATPLAPFARAIRHRQGDSVCAGRC
jgi:hypothetical protein